MKKYLVNNYVITGLIFMGLGFLSVVLTRSSDKDTTLAAVKKQDVIQKVTVAGNVIPFRKTVISAPYNGYIKKIYVTLGQEVKAGSPVVSIVQSLHASSDDSYPLRAPFSGTVVQILRTEGEYVETGKDTSAIVRIDDKTRLFVLADVPESEVDKIKVGQEAEIKTTMAQALTFKGIIREIAMAAKEKNASFSRMGDRVEFTVKIEVVKPDDSIKSGMSTIVDIVTSKKTKTLALRHEYIEKDDTGYFVTTEEGKRKDVTVGLQNEDVIEILSGLNEGEKIRMVDFFSLSKNKK